MSALEKLLNRLQRVRRTGDNTYSASCPTDAHKHGDRSRGLGIRERDDGVVLVKCRAGCRTLDVLAAVGLGWSALFPANSKGAARTASTSRIPARDLLEAISKETSVVAVIAADMRDQRSISEADWKRLAQAAARIGAARDHVHGR
jgi:hypothetical protein